VLAGRARVAVWGVLAVALLLRLTLVVATYHQPITLDPADFSRTAVSIAQNQVYPQSNRAPGGGPSAFRPPGYPMLLGAVYAVAGQEAPGIGRLVGAFLGTISVALIGLIAARLWGRRVGMCAAVIAAIAPPLVVLSTALVSEALFVPIVLAATATAIEARRAERPARWVVATGVLVGAAALTRTNGLILLLPFSLALAPARSRWRLRAVPPQAAVVVIAALVIAPWTIRNALVFHRFIPLSTEIGYTLAGTYDQASRNDHRWPAVWVEAEHGASLEYGEILFDAEIHRWNEPTYGDHLLAAAISDIRRDPAYLLKVGLWNSLRMFHLTEQDFAVGNLSGTDIPRIPALFEIYGFYPLALLALGGLLTRRARSAPRWLWLVPVCLATTVFVTGFIRFRSPIDPFLAILAALPVAALLDRHSRRSVRPGDDAEVDPNQTRVPELAAVAALGNAT
jgi:4-amino-4-deoxy-L-arabinose transferase-like glycosyltransferase